MLSDILVRYALPLALTALLAATGWAAVRLSAYLNSKTHSTKAFAFLDKLSHFGAIAVQDILQNEKPIIDQIAATGKITPADFKTLSAKALERLKIVLGKDGISTLEQALGVFAPGVEQYLSGVATKSVLAVVGTGPSNAPNAPPVPATLNP